MGQVELPTGQQERPEAEHSLLEERQSAASGTDDRFDY
jgi:hypothetical protein